jgi:hypothetical protein
MVKAVLKGAPLKKAPLASSSPTSASPPSFASTPPNGAVASQPKRPARSGSNSPHPHPLSSSFESGTPPHSHPGAIDIPPPHEPTVSDDPIPLSSSASFTEVTDDSVHLDATPTDDSDTTTPPSSARGAARSSVENPDTENSEASEFAAVSLEDAPSHLEPPVTRHSPIVEDLDDLGLGDDEDDFDDDDEDDDEKKKKAKEKFDTIKFKKDINTLLDEIDKEMATPTKKVNPGIKDMLSPFFTKRPKNKTEMETNLKDKGIVPREDRKKKDKH